MNNIEAKISKAIEYQSQGKFNEATDLFIEILKTDPGNVVALYSLTGVALNKHNYALALELIERALKAPYFPFFEQIHYVHGLVLEKLGRKEEALLSYDAALKIKPDYLDALNNSGVLLRSMLRHKEALEKFNDILKIAPLNQLALANCGVILSDFKLHEQAISMYERLFKLNPDYDYISGLLFYRRLSICDWTDFETLKQLLIQGVRQGKRAGKSFEIMSASDLAEDHLLAAKTFAQQHCPPHGLKLWQGERYRHRKIRLAYLSPDFREHPVAYLMAGIFEQHDKSRFELFAFSFGLDDNSALRQRIQQSFDQFLDVSMLGSLQIAQMMREMEIDIAIDLGGYTKDMRYDVLSYRPAPVQLGYLGYPGTLGTDFMDYILADRYVIPEAHQTYYREKVIYLPDTYLPCDNTITIPDDTPSRLEYGLPETGMVFCAFSHNNKLSPSLFSIWLTLLKQTPASVLWLNASGDSAKRNLLIQAQAAGIQPERLIFAERLAKVEDHLLRYRVADIFLDTYPYNAHTTALDALMLGLPVLTCMGQSFPSRVAGSLLMSLGVTELITHSLDEYQNLALTLAHHPEQLNAIKQRIRENTKTSPLFDTAQFCRNLEAVYFSLWRKTELSSARDALC